MNLQDLSTKDLLALHNKIADKPAGPKTFSTKVKLASRIQVIIADQHIDLAALWPLGASKVTGLDGRSQSDVAETLDAPECEKIQRGKGIGALARQLLLDPKGHPHKLIATLVNEQLDGARATDKSIRWYANDMRKRGFDVPSRQKPNSKDVENK